MATLDTLLDRLGTPPPEVCLDWSWQIEDALNGKLDEPLEWSHIELDDDGELSVVASRRQSTESPHSSARELVDQLLTWSQAEQTANTQTPVSLVESTLRVTGVVQPASTPAVSTTSTVAAAQQPELRPVPTQSREVPTAPKPARRFSVRQQLGAAAACVLLMGLGIIFLINRGTGDNRPHALAAPAEHHAPALPTASKKKPLAENWTSDPTSSNAELDSALQFERASIEELESAPSGAMLEDELLSDATDSPILALPSLDSLAPMSTLPTTVNETANHDPAATAAEPVERPNAADHGSLSTEVEDVDLVAEMEKVTRQAEAQELERDIAAVEQVHGSPAEEAVLLSTSPMNQLQRFSPKLTGGVREPQWMIRLEAGDGFMVSPATAQPVTGKVATRWLIANTEADTPATQVIVVARLQNARSPALRWRIVAGAEDVPQIALPLGREFLDAMQENLNYSSQRLQVGIEQLKAWGKTTGLPTEVRSAMSRQRRRFESQLEIGKRLLEIVADANQMDGWMDRQIAVHAELRDAKQPAAAPRLVFGSVELPAPEQAASDEAKQQTEGHARR